MSLAFRRAAIALAAVITFTVAFTLSACAQSAPPQAAPNDPCRSSAQACVSAAIDAMGGRAKLESVKTLQYESLAYTELTEQSYRQAPFINSYTHAKGTIDFPRQRLLSEVELTWPESDPGQSKSNATVVASPDGAVSRATAKDSPTSAATIDSARFAITLNPLKLLLAAAADPNLKLGEPELLRQTLHPALVFTYEGRPAKILINPFNHLPDAIERTTAFNDFWREWGDVTQRIYLDNWQIFKGIPYPTNAVEERNGILWQSTQIIALDVNVPTTDDTFKMDATVAAQSAKQKMDAYPFRAAEKIDLAPGVTLYPGPWNATIVKQDDGIVLLESPLSGLYFGGVIDQTKKLYPDTKIKSVLSTSDSWPHVAGVRTAVSLGLPIYILDLNQPLLDRMIAAPHTLNPDALAKSPKPAQWHVVAGKTVVGSGPNRMELYPIRGASTERQYMVYFPEHKILYASDTLVVNDDGSIYDPELMREVVAAVEREHLDVTTVFAMHQTPIPYKQAADAVQKALAATP
jgi:hypothetical protein